MITDDEHVSGGMILAGVREAGQAGVGGSNCDQLPDMSLFHNLKLKRRKVDSRGSSDGEYKHLQFRRDLSIKSYNATSDKINVSIVLFICIIE